jgi:hypothetical protein
MSGPGTAEHRIRERVSRASRKWFLYGVICALSIVVAVLSIFGFILRHQVNDARARVTLVETNSRFAQVATCYAAARGRPQLFVILRGIAVKLDPTPRAATLDLVDRYEAQTPTLAGCDHQALAAGFKPSDFPPPKTGRNNGQ